MAGLFDENRVRDNAEDWMGSNKKEQGKNKMFVLEQMREFWKTLSVQINFCFQDEKQMLDYISHTVEKNVLKMPFSSQAHDLSVVISFQ